MRSHKCRQSAAYSSASQITRPSLRGAVNSNVGLKPRLAHGVGAGRIEPDDLDERDDERDERGVQGVFRAHRCLGLVECQRSACRLAIAQLKMIGGMDKSRNRTAPIAKHLVPWMQRPRARSEAMALPSCVGNVQARLEATGPVWSALANHHLARFGCLRYQRSSLYTRRPTAPVSHGSQCRARRGRFARDVLTPCRCAPSSSSALLTLLLVGRRIRRALRSHAVTDSRDIGLGYRVSVLVEPPGIASATCFALAVPRRDKPLPPCCVGWGKKQARR